MNRYCIIFFGKFNVWSPIKAYLKAFQAYLIFQPVYKYFKTITNTNYILSWKSKGLSAESIKPFSTSDNSLTPAINYYDYNIRVRFTGGCIKRPKISYTHKK